MRGEDNGDEAAKGKAAAPGRSGAGGGGSSGEQGDVPGIRDAPASAERGERRLPPPPPPPPPPSPPPSPAVPRSAPQPPAPPGAPSPRRAPIEPPSVPGWGLGESGEVRGVGGGTRQDKEPGGAEDSRGTEPSPHRSASRTMPRPGGPGATPNTGCLHRRIHPCPPVLLPPPQGPACPAEPPPLPWACGELRGSRITGVHDPQNHHPRTLPAPAGLCRPGENPRFEPDSAASRNTTTPPAPTPAHRVPPECGDSEATSAEGHLSLPGPPSWPMCPATR
ncbi:basic proline-rich protein-like [Prinia subflava]|uniref:basic proline-rich protein-like n=1 Tax=Prinia subflava TaxID=208062 RepID=UPI002FE15667